MDCIIHSNMRSPVSFGLSLTTRSSIIFIQLSILVYAALIIAEKDYVIRVSKITTKKGSVCNANGLKIVRVNASMSMLTGKYGCQGPLPNSSVINIIAKEQQANGKYTEFGPLTKRNMPLCNVVTTDKAYAEIRKTGNLPKQCPVRKGVYQMKYMMNEKSLPDRLPLRDKWNVNITVMNGQRLLSEHGMNVLLDRSKGSKG